MLQLGDRHSPIPRLNGLNQTELTRCADVRGKDKKKEKSEIRSSFGEREKFPWEFERNSPSLSHLCTSLVLKYARNT